VRQVHSLVVPQVPAQPVRRACGGGRRGGRLGVPALPRRLQLQQLPQGAGSFGTLSCSTVRRTVFALEDYLTHASVLKSCKAVACTSPARSRSAERQSSSCRAPSVCHCQSHADTRTAGRKWCVYAFHSANSSLTVPEDVFAYRAESGPCAHWHPGQRVTRRRVWQRQRPAHTGARPQPPVFPRHAPWHVPTMLPLQTAHTLYTYVRGLLAQPVTVLNEWQGMTLPSAAHTDPMTLCIWLTLS